MAGFVDLNERASHPCGIYRGEPFSVFAKLDTTSGGEQFTAELRGLNLLARIAAVTTPVPIADGTVDVEGGPALMLEAIAEIPAEARTPGQWRSIGAALARLHSVRGDCFGLNEFDGFFGPLPQDNRPVASNSWAGFYAERRLLPMLKSAVDSGNLPSDLATEVERIAARLPTLCGPEPLPALLHGDAQQNNFLTTADDAVLFDTAPYFGHPEVDLALIDYFEPVPREVFAGYQEIASIDHGFAQRRELWRLFAYLAVIAVDGHNLFGRTFLSRLAEAIALYR